MCFPSQLLAFKAELESRPKQDELDQKQQLCDSLAENLSTLRSEVDELRTLNDRCQLEMERMEIELLKQKNIENEKISASTTMASRRLPGPCSSADRILIRLM